MRKFNHQDIDWDHFSDYENQFVARFIENIKPLFIRQKISLSDIEIYSIFGVLLSENAFINYLDEREIYYGNRQTAKPHNFRVDKVEVKPSAPETWLDLGFFHRHQQYKNSFEKAGGLHTEILITHRRKTEINIAGLLSQFALENYDVFVLHRLVFLLVNKSLLNGSAPNILGSNHGIYDGLASIYLAKAKRENSKVVLVQPGLIHLQAKYMHQVKYELALATDYIGWGGKRDEINIHQLGTMYSSRALEEGTPTEGALILLPQIARVVPRPFSFHWSHFFDCERLIQNLLPKILEIKKRHDKVLARCKRSDLQQYQHLFEQNNIEITLEGADVNNGVEHFKTFAYTYNTYFSTGIAEAFHRGSNVQLAFSESSYLLNPRFDNETAFFAEDVTNQISLKKYLGQYAKSITPDLFNQKLISILST